MGTLISVWIGVLGLSTGAADSPDAVGPSLRRSMIWIASAPSDKQVYGVFRKRFDLDALPKTALMHIFADSRYVLWVNGRYVDRGPCRFDPIAPEYDMLNLMPFLRTGNNAVAVLVHHYTDGKAGGPGEFCGRIMRHIPGLTARIDLTAPSGERRSLVTDSTWRATTKTRFCPSPSSWGSIPDNIDARLDEGDWTLAGFDDTGWEAAVSVDGSKWGPLRPRAIPLLREKEVGPLKVLGNSPTAEPRLLSEMFPIDMGAGQELVIDIGVMEQAYSVLDFDADAGSRLELLYAQRFLDAGRRPSETCGQKCDYVARAGRQTYMSGDTFGFKYLVIRAKSGRIRLLEAKVISRRYPFDCLGRFTSNDPLLNKLWANSVHTVQVCSEDAYVDCATRERVEWMADGFIDCYTITRVALAGPGDDGRPRLGDPRLLRNLLRHIGQSVQPDGRIKAHHPSDRWDIHGYIEDYSCLWVQAIRSYYEHTGDPGPARELWPAVTAQMKWFLDHRTERGLLKAREFVFPGNPLVYKTCEGAALNAYLYRAFRDAAFLAALVGQEAERAQYDLAASALSRDVNVHLWDQASGTYCGSIMDGKKTPPTAHAAVLCLYHGIVPDDRREVVMRWVLENHRKEDFAPYTHHFLFRVLYQMDTDAADREVLDLMRQRFGAMTRNETGTVWEGFGGGEFCHQMGSQPAYYLSAYVLGVRTDGPISNKRIIIRPRPGDLKEASGVIVTEFGLVPVSWRLDDQGKGLDFRFEVPAGARAMVSIPKSGPAPTLVMDGRSVVRSGKPDVSDVVLRGRYYVTELGPGIHAGGIR
jgi:alpha-L-rhamnosidase